MVRKIVGTFLYYSLAVDSTIMVALSNLVETQSKATEKTYYNMVWLLNYAVINPTVVFRYKQIKMVLRFHSDASYLSVTKARSRAGGYHYLTDDSEDPPDNGPIQNLCKIMTNFMGSAAEA